MLTSVKSRTKAGFCTKSQQIVYILVARGGGEGGHTKANKDVCREINLITMDGNPKVNNERDNIPSFKSIFTLSKYGMRFKVKQSSLIRTLFP